MNALDTATATLVDTLTESGMNREGAAAMALVMRQALTDQPKAATMLLQAITTGDTAMAESIARELYEKSATWLTDSPDTVAEIFAA